MLLIFRSFYSTFGSGAEAGRLFVDQEVYGGNRPRGLTCSLDEWTKAAHPPKLPTHIAYISDHGSVRDQGGDVSNPLARRDSGSRASSPSNIGHSHPRYRDFSCQRAGPADFLRWSLSTRGFSLVETRHSHLIKSRVNFLRRDQITHGRLKGFVPHPVLDRTNVEPGPKSPRRIGRPKCFEIELRVVQSGTLGDRLTVVEHMVLTVSGRETRACSQDGVCSPSAVQ